MQLSTEHQCVSLSGQSEVMALQSGTGHSHTHRMSRGSRQVFLHLYSATQSQEMSSKGVFLNPCVWDSHGTLTHSSTSSRCENKNPKSDIRSAWKLVCLLECDELACSHPVLASFLLQGFFPQCSPIQGWREEGLEPRNLFGIIATIESLCARPVSESERESENRSVAMVCITGRGDVYMLVTCTHYYLWATLLSRTGSGHAFAFVYPGVGQKRRNLT